MKLHTINTGLFKLDGGAMFGVVPKVVWQKLVTPDENNLCTWAMRCLLVEDENRLILIDTGIGNKQEAKFLAHYHLHGNDTLIKSIRQLGFSEDDITDVILTHLHFDHCGGAVKKENEKLSLTFKNAVIWSNQAHLDWATAPNPREKASFLTENILPMQESGHLKFITSNAQNQENQQKSPFQNIDFLFVDGHTEKQMLPLITLENNKKLLYCADLFPSVAHIPLPYVMGYDMRPLITMQEKEQILAKAVAENITLFFEHDAQNECCNVQMTEKGVRMKEVFSLKDI